MVCDGARYRVTIEQENGQTDTLLVQAPGVPEHVVRVIAHSVALGAALLDGETEEEESTT